MKFSVEYNPDFFNDITQAVDWYNEKTSRFRRQTFK
jgi:hypothetical protein